MFQKRNLQTGKISIDRERLFDISIKASCLLKTNVQRFTMSIVKMEHSKQQTNGGKIKWQEIIP